MASVIYGLIVFGLALFFVIIFCVFLHFRRHKKTSLLPYTFYLTILTVGLQAATLPRNLFASPTMYHSDISDPLTASDLPPVVLWVSRLSSLIIPVVVTERIVHRLMHYGQGEKLPTVLLLSFIFYFVTSVLFSAFLSSHPSLSHEYFYLFLGGIGALLSTEVDGDNAIKFIRNAIFILLVISAIYLVIKPEYVMENHYTEGLIPGMTFRYVGLTGSANSIGAMVVVYMLCLSNRPYSKGWLNQCAWFMGIVTLVIAQSKTSWITFLMGMACLAYFQHIDIIKRYFLNFRRPMLPAVFIVMGMVFATGLVLVIMFGSSNNVLGSFFSTKAGASLLTMTGRDQIWVYAVREWHRSPLFGYGLTIWNDAYQAKIGIPGAVHAHNQFYQTLSSSGIVGVVGLIVYIMTLFWFTLKTARASKGLSLAFFMMLMLHSVSEVSFSMVGHFGPQQIEHSIILMVIVANLPRQPKAAYSGYLETLKT